jgi:hypothetical protein
MAPAMRARSLFSVAGALAAGAIATFFLDPEQGRRRRGIARDKLASGLRQASESSQAFAEDLRNRSSGLVAGARRRLRREQIADAPDDAAPLEPRDEPGDIPGAQR